MFRCLVGDAIYGLQSGRDKEGLDRNLEGVIGELAEVCERIFRHAAGATSRSAVVSGISLEGNRKRMEEEGRRERPEFPIRERTRLEKVASVDWYMAKREAEMDCIEGGMGARTHFPPAD